MKIEISGLEQLAAKLGTTTEYLWAVLVKQATISASMDTLLIVLVVAVWSVVYRYRKEIYEFLDNGNDVPQIFGFFTGLLLFLMTILAMFCIFTAISAFVHPEYWALKQVLEAMK